MAEAYISQQSSTAIPINIHDIRELQRDGRVNGALHAPRCMLEFQADPNNPYHKDIFATRTTLVLFYAINWCSALATKTLQDTGMYDIWYLGGSCTASTAAGFPIRKIG